MLNLLSTSIIKNAIVFLQQILKPDNRCRYSNCISTMHIDIHPHPLAGVGADISNKGKTISSIHFAANNLTNIAYQNRLRLKYTDVNNVTGREGVYEVGRNFSIKIDFPIRVKI